MKINRMLAAVSAATMIFHGLLGSVQIQAQDTLPVQDANKEEEKDSSLEDIAIEEKGTQEADQENDFNEETNENESSIEADPAETNENEVTDATVFDENNRTEINGVIYKLNSDNSTVSVVGASDSVPENLEIESSVGGYSVKQIMDDAFYGNPTIKTVVIPEGVEVIGQYAFYYSHKLSSIQIPTTVKEINYQALSVENLNIKYSGTRAQWKKINLEYQSYSDTFSFLFNGPSIESATVSMMPEKVVLLSDSHYDYDMEKWIYISIPKPVVTINGKVLQRNKDYDIRCTNTSAVGVSELIIEGLEYSGQIVIPFEIISNDIVGKKYTEQNVEYELAEDGWLVSDYQNALSGKVNLLSFIDGISVIGIKDGAFKNCYKLTEISIPDTTIYIGGSGFAGCRNLTTVHFSRELNTIGYEAFSGCKKLNNVVFPDSLRSLNEGAFADCTSLTEISIPDQVYVYSNVFNGCSNLQTVHLPKNIGSRNYEYCHSLFANCTSLQTIDLPNGLTHINSWFYNCTSLTSISLPDTITGLSESFERCSSLSSVNLNDGLQAIGQASFKDCTALKSLSIPESVTMLGDEYSYEGAFEGCTNLVTINIPEKVTEIGRSTFKDCHSLRSANLSDRIYTLGSEVFRNCLSLKTIELPESVEYLGSYAFAGCENLESVKLSNELVTIEESTFEGCVKLKDIILPGANGSARIEAKNTAGIQSIGNYAFYGCSNLRSIYIPASLKSVGRYAFNECTSLQTVQFDGTSAQWNAVSIDEGNNALKNVAITTSDGKVEGNKPMYRLYNPNSGEHFYTADLDEFNHLKKVGWRDEGIGWYAPAKSNTPVYRLYNKNAGDHHYTTDISERDHLIKVGWKNEGIGWYSDDKCTVPLYRQYNPNAKSGSHNYTTDIDEHYWLTSIGWRDEGIGWYGA